MFRLRQLFSDSRFLTVVGFAAAFLILVAGAYSFQLTPAGGWAHVIGLGLIGLGLLGLTVVLWRQRRARQAHDALNAVLEQAPASTPAAIRGTNTDGQALTQRMRDAVRTIMNSRLGHGSGRAALYELPWYVVIGNPAAGKSSAIGSSGLKFPFEDGAGKVVKGVGGTRDCDWFFTTEGILLDTAGRYATEEDDRDEWLHFLSQLRKHRPLAPINGIIITASLAELAANPPEFTIALARSLRQRIQELTEHLGVFAPAYVMFTKADLVAGFNEFFSDLDWNERDRVWGATLPYAEGERGDAVSRFERHFDELYQGLRELGVAQMSRAQGAPLQPGLIAFPLEFAALKPTLRIFIATLFEENPYQFEPVFRGFYLTSALQSGETVSRSHERIESRFGLAGEEPMPERVGSQNGFFLRDLFSRVIFADRQLVRPYRHAGRLRARRAAVLASLAVLGLVLGGWSWSYASNRALADTVRADLDRIIGLQQDSSDLQSRLAALEVLQDRILQLEHFATDTPLALGLGLHQGSALRAKLLDEYHNGIRSVLLEPVREHLEALLAEFQEHADGSARSGPHAPTAPPVGARPAAAADADGLDDRFDAAYNALKTYLMLGNREHFDAGHLSDQLPRVWRPWLEAHRGSMSRDEQIRRAERILSFHLTHPDAHDWPLIENDPALVDRSREFLRRLAHGAPAIERVYGEIRARASTRFAPLTVAGLLGPGSDALLSGRHLVSGTFTVEAWNGYVRQAIDDAAVGELQGSDWVLKRATREDLSLHGSPDQIRKALTAMYRKDYAEEWRRFMLGVGVIPFADFPAAVAAMDRLGDPKRSPIGQLLRTLGAHTAWNARAPFGSPPADAGLNFLQRIGRMFMPGASATPIADAARAGAAPADDAGMTDPIFAGVERLLLARDDGPALDERYLQHLASIRSRLKQLAHQGDPGPGTVRLLQATLDGQASELADALRFVDEQMLAGVDETQRTMLRPLLLGPLVHSYAAALGPAEHELNRIWSAQVLDPFMRKLSPKYPFSAAAQIEATPAEIAQIFGPDGAIARFVDTTLGTLVIRRGNTVAPRTWGELGVALHPEFVAGLGRWIGPLEGAAAASAGTTADAQTTFMLLPHPAAGVTGYTIEIDGQRLQYRNGAAQWATFVWPNPGADPGARIHATRFDGTRVEIADFAGRFGLERLLNAARRTRNPDGSFTLGWGSDELPVRIGLRIISSSQAEAADEAPRKGIAGGLPARVAGHDRRAPDADADTPAPDAAGMTVVRG